MRRTFIDANHLIALVNPKDQWHQMAKDARAATSNDKLVTTEEVLTEFLNFYADAGQYMRQNAAGFVRRMLVDVRIEILAHVEQTFLNALEFYESRLDKGYSLTDCISMNVCDDLGIKDVLTSDDHFQQEGFNVLLK